MLGTDMPIPLRQRAFSLKQPTSSVALLLTTLRLATMTKLVDSSLRQGFPAPPA